MKKKKIWRFAFPDCREQKLFLEKNEGIDFFAHERLFVLFFTIACLSIIFVVITLIWNLVSSLIKNNNVTLVSAKAFLIAEVIIIVFSIGFFSLSWIYIQTQIIVARRRITRYQDFWPTILEVVEDHIDDLTLPEEAPRKEEMSFWEERDINLEEQELKIGDKITETDDGPVLNNDRAIEFVPFDLVIVKLQARR